MPRGCHPRSRANLRPPWCSGESGNPDGRPARVAPEPGAELELSPAGLGMSDEEFAAMVGPPTVERKPPPVRCSVCRHQDRPVVDGLLVLGIPLRAVTRSYGLARSALDRHRRLHLPRFSADSEARAVTEAGKLLPSAIEKLRYAGRFNLASTWPVFDRLWRALDASLGDSAKDRLLLALASACVWLFRVQEQSDVRKAIRALEAWRAIPDP